MCETGRRDETRDEIDVTPEMIRAGEEAFEAATEFASVSGVMPWVLVERVYIAMRKKCLCRAQ
jgi:hypothetical protein